MKQSFWQKLREANRNGFLVKRVEGRFSYTKTGYRFNRALVKSFLGASILLLALAFVYGLMSGVKLHEIYISCEDGTPLPGCRNPYYLRCDDSFCREISQQEYFGPGMTYGIPPSNSYVLLVKLSSWGAWIIFIGGLVINHFMYNKGKTPLELDEK